MQNLTHSDWTTCLNSDRSRGHDGHGTPSCHPGPGGPCRPTALGRVCAPGFSILSEFRGWGLVSRTVMVTAVGLFASWSQPWPFHGHCPTGSLENPRTQVGHTVQVRRGLQARPVEGAGPLRRATAFHQHPAALTPILFLTIPSTRRLKAALAQGGLVHGRLGRCVAARDLPGSTAYHHGCQWAAPTPGPSADSGLTPPGPHPAADTGAVLRGCGGLPWARVACVPRKGGWELPQFLLAQSGAPRGPHSTRPVAVIRGQRKLHGQVLEVPTRLEPHRPWKGLGHSLQVPFYGERHALPSLYH